MKKAFLFVFCFLLILSSCGKKPNSGPKNEDLPDNVIEGTVVKAINLMFPSAYAEEVVDCPPDVNFCARLLDSESEEILAAVPVIDGKFKFKLRTKVFPDRIYKVVIVKRDDDSYQRILVFAGVEAKRPVLVDLEATLVSGIKRKLLKNKLYELRDFRHSNLEIEEINQSIKRFLLRLEETIKEDDSSKNLKTIFGFLSSNLKEKLPLFLEEIVLIFSEFKINPNDSILIEKIKYNFRIGSKKLEISEEFEMYVLLFKKKSQEYGKKIEIDNLIIRLDDNMEDRQMGECVNPIWPPTPQIKISKKYWNVLSESGREELIFHNLGHCILNRPHREDIQKEGLIPYSIMYPYHLGHTRYLANYDQYMYELFTGEDLQSALPLVNNFQE